MYTVDHCLKAAEKLRSFSKVLVSYTLNIKPHRAVTSCTCTIGQWIKTLLCQAGTDTEIISSWLDKKVHIQEDQEVTNQMSLALLKYM